MKIRSLAWMGAGLLLAGVAGAAVVNRRKGGRELPEEPEETPEHAALRDVLKLSSAYNDSLYERMLELEKVEAPEALAAAVRELTLQNQENRRLIDSQRADLQARLAEQGRTFADVDGFVELLSEYRDVTLRQQKRHLEVFHRVRQKPGVPASPELHAYLKLGFKEEEQMHADTDMQLMKAAGDQRELMLRAGRVIGAIADAASAAAAAQELNELGNRYMELTARIKLYREDDPSGAEHAVAELRTMYAGLLPMLKVHATRLRERNFYGDGALRAVMTRMLPAE